MSANNRKVKVKAPRSPNQNQTPPISPQKKQKQNQSNKIEPYLKRKDVLNILEHHIPNDGQFLLRGVSKEHWLRHQQQNVQKQKRWKNDLIKFINKVSNANWRNTYKRIRPDNGRGLRWPDPNGRGLLSTRDRHIKSVDIALARAKSILQRPNWKNASGVYRVFDQLQKVFVILSKFVYHPRSLGQGNSNINSKIRNFIQMRQKFYSFFDGSKGLTTMYIKPTKNRNMWGETWVWHTLPPKNNRNLIPKNNVLHNPWRYRNGEPRPQFHKNYFGNNYNARTMQGPILTNQSSMPIIWHDNNDNDNFYI